MKASDNDDSAPSALADTSGQCKSPAAIRRGALALSSECQQGGRVQSSISTRAVFPRLDYVPQLGYNEGVSKGRTTKWRRATKSSARTDSKSWFMRRRSGSTATSMRFSTGNKCAFSAAVAAVTVSCICFARTASSAPARWIAGRPGASWWKRHGNCTRVSERSGGPKSRALRLAPTYKLCRIYAHRYPDRVSTRH